MKKIRSFSLTSSTLLLAASLAGVSIARAGDFDLKSTVDNKGDSKDIGEGNFGRSRFVFTSDARFGYDDNTLSQPDSVTFTQVNPATGKNQTITRDVDTSGSTFVNFTLGGTYRAASPRTTLTIGADVGVNYYFDRPGRDYDINGGLTINFAYRATPRLLLEVTSFNSYQSEPDFGASNLTGFSGSGVIAGSAPGFSSQRNGDFFYTTDRLAATYQFTQRISTVTSYNLVAFAYADDPYKTVEDRAEHYFTQDLRYLLNPTLTIVGEYRFGYIDYFDVANDSYSNFALLGADYSFNPRFRFSGRAGVEFREYVDQAVGSDEETSPYVEASLIYDLATSRHLTFTGRYGIEQGDLSASANTTRRAYRIGTTYDQSITPKLSVYLGFYFSDSDYNAPESFDAQTNSFVPGDFSEQSYDVATGVRYAFNRHLSAELGYTHTSVVSDIDGRDYDRNRYFGGLRFQF